MCNYYFGILGGRYQLILQCIINIMFISLVGILLRELRPPLQQCVYDVGTGNNLYVCNIHSDFTLLIFSVEYEAVLP